MNEQEWSAYVDRGEVPYHFFESMIDLIRSGERLNLQHLAVYRSHGEVIENLLKLKSKREE